MQIILTVAIAAVLLTSLYLVIRWGRLILNRTMPTKLFAFIAILFTSGLDVGLIMFPLTEFPTYEAEEVYSFANPLAIEFGFWGFLIWAFYFLTTFYFCLIEPKLKLFEIPWVKFVNNFVIIATCAFTGYLFLTYLPGYFPIFDGPLKYLTVASVVLCAVLSSTDIRYVKLLSLGSTWLFFALIATMWFVSGMGVGVFGNTIAGIGEYFMNIQKFVSPLSDYHAFYLFWWFAWSIMIGQFVARFVGGLSTRQLLLALLVFPSIPIAIWFTVLYHYHIAGLEISPVFKIAMVSVGVVFVVNSLDSLTRLYSNNLNLTVKRLGGKAYVAFHFCLLFGLILLYQFTPFKIEWVGLVVIALYAAVYILLVQRRHSLRGLGNDRA